MEQLRSVLIIQTAFIGDVILATALVESLHEKFPAASIDFVVRNGNEELLVDHPVIRNLFVLDKRHKYKSLLSLVKAFRKNHYEYVINVQRFATTGLMTILAGSRNTIGFDKNPLSMFFSKRVPHVIGELHEVERNQRLLEAFNITARSKPRLFPSRKQFEKVQEFKTGVYITVSPASVWFTKQWPVEKWIEFLEGVDSKWRIFLLGAADDVACCKTILDGIPEKNVLNLAGKLSLLESAALMKDAHMNFVNDSAPMHLASAMNAPVTAVYCSTLPSFGFGPLSDAAFVVETTESLECRPCGLHGLRNCPQGHFKCARTISPEQLLRVL